MKKLSFRITMLFALPALFAASAYGNTVPLDTTFNGTGYSIREVVPPPGKSFGKSMALQSDGKIVIAGNTVENQSPDKIAVMRLNSDGTLDTSFDTDGVVLMNIASLVEIIKVLILPDGKILLGGSSGTNDTALDFLLIRLNPDGSPDTSFNSTGSVVQTINGFSIDYLQDITLQPDGKIIAVGKTFGLPQTALPYDFGVMRFNPTGALDTTFDGDGILTIGTPNVDETAEAVIVQADGKILVGGLRSATQNIANFLLVRRNADGTPDASFGSGGATITNAGPIFHYIQTLAQQSDGKILAAGTNYAARYTTGGILDTSFATNGVASLPTDITKIKVIGGDKFLLAPRVGARPLRYMKDGAPDTNFRAGVSIPNQLCFQAGIDVQSDGKILLGGYCTANNDSIARFAVIRLQETRTKRFLDFNGDGSTEISIFRPSTGQWLISSSFDNQVTTVAFGTATDRPVPADFTGDGRADIAVFRPSTGEWFVLRSDTGTFYSFPFGTSGDVPVPGDYDGDQLDDAGVFRPSTGEWFIQKSTGGVIITRFGLSEDKPVPSDYDGDFKTDIAIYRPSMGEWWVQKSSDSNIYAFQFGTSTDKPVPGDYTGDGKTDAAFWRPATGEWFILRSEDYSYYSVPFGLSDDLPTPGHYAGDDRYDLVVFRPSTNTWHIQMTGGFYFYKEFGAAGDQPLPNLFVP
jgi:uncharacterized delta-60 repeat protein